MQSLHKAGKLTSEQNPYEPNPLLQLAINPLTCQSNNSFHTALTAYVPAPHDHSQHNQVCAICNLIPPPFSKPVLTPTLHLHASIWATPHTTSTTPLANLEYDTPTFQPHP